MKKCRYHVFVCGGRRCEGRGSKEVYEKFSELRDKYGLTDVKVTSCRSIDHCDIGPNIVVYPDNVWYHGVGTGDVEEIVKEHLVEGTSIERLRGDMELEERKEDFFRSIISTGSQSWEELVFHSKDMRLGEEWLDDIKYYFEELPGEPRPRYRVKERVARRRFNL